MGHSVVFLVVHMAPCYLGTHSTVKEFTILLIHVLHVSRPAVLNESTGYTCEIVDFFFENTPRLIAATFSHLFINSVI